MFDLFVTNTGLFAVPSFFNRDKWPGARDVLFPVSSQQCQCIDEGLFRKSRVLTVRRAPSLKKYGGNFIVQVNEKSYEPNKLSQFSQ